MGNPTSLGNVCQCLPPVAELHLPWVKDSSWSHALPARRCRRSWEGVWAELAKGMFPYHRMSCLVHKLQGVSQKPSITAQGWAGHQSVYITWGFGHLIYISLFVISLLITNIMMQLLLYFISIIKLLLPQPTYLSRDSPLHPTGIEGWGNDQAAVWYWVAGWG